MNDKCTVADGRFVNACETLQKVTDYRAAEGRKGVVVWEYTNLNTHKPSRTIYGVKTKEYPKGIAFNVCPFCGERIDAPFCEDSDSGGETK